MPEEKPVERKDPLSEKPEVKKLLIEVMERGLVDLLREGQNGRCGCNGDCGCRSVCEACSRT